MILFNSKEESLQYFSIPGNYETYRAANGEMMIDMFRSMGWLPALIPAAPAEPIVPAALPMPTAEAVWEAPAHEEIPLSELDPVELGLDPFASESDARLADAIIESKRQTQDLRTSALRALDLGIRVFALGEAVKEPDSVESPNGFKSSTNDRDRVSDIWTRKPKANIGVDCGGSDLCVLDFDHKEDIPAWVNSLKTLKVKTSRGLHVYLRGARPSKKMYEQTGKHIGEIKSTGGYVIWDKSVHPSGAVYLMVEDSPIAPVPDDRLIELTKHAPAASKASPSLEGDKIPHGQHDIELTRVAGKLRQAGMEEDSIYNAITEVCEKRCEGYGSDYLEMCRKIAKSVCRYEPGKNTDLALTQAPEQAPDAEAEKPIVTVNGDDFLTETIPPRKVLVSTISGNEPVIFEQSINQVFAWRGAGKTCLGMGFVRALATAGSFLNFKASERSYVLYVEGELPDSQFQERWKSIVGKTDGYAHMASIDKQPGHHYVSMATEVGMAKVEATLADLASKGVNIKILMLDNISTLFNVKANEEEVWIPIQSWFTSLRSRGITVFFFHHAGKGGLSRSHSKSEDMLDVSIKLEEPEEPEQGHLHSLMTFDKARAGLSEKPAEIKLHRTHSTACQCGGTPGILFCPGDGVIWEHVPKVSKRDEAYRLFAEGASVDKVKLDLDVPEGTVKTWKTNWNKMQQAKKAGG